VISLPKVEGQNKKCKELEELNAHKENVLAILSHDLEAHLRVLFRVLNI
jgi:hypothetical protein